MRMRRDLSPAEDLAVPRSYQRYDSGPGGAACRSLTGNPRQPRVPPPPVRTGKWVLRGQLGNDQLGTGVSGSIS